MGNVPTTTSHRGFVVIQCNVGHKVKKAQWKNSNTNISTKFITCSCCCLNQPKKNINWQCKQCTDYFVCHSCGVQLQQSNKLKSQPNKASKMAWITKNIDKLEKCIHDDNYDEFVATIHLMEQHCLDQQKDGVSKTIDFNLIFNTQCKKHSLLTLACNHNSIKILEKMLQISIMCQQNNSNHLNVNRTNSDGYNCVWYCVKQQQ